MAGTMQGFPSRATVNSENTHRFKILGVNDANPTTQLGLDLATITRTGEGAYLATWKENPGIFAAIGGFGFIAATPADLKGYTVVFDTYDSSTKSMPFVVYNSAFVAADLIANQYLAFSVVFQVNGPAAR